MSEKKKNKRDMTTGSIMGHVLRMSVPMAIGIGAIISYSVADIYFIGQIGAVELAAVSYTIPVTTLFFNVIFGLAIAMSAVISRKVGAGLHDEVTATATIGVSMSLIASLVLAIATFLFLDPIFHGLGAGDETLPYIHEYMDIWLIGAVFLAAPVVINSAIRGNGDAFWPAVVMVSVAVINFILDPILIFGLFGAPEMGVQGAALASTISYILSMVIASGIFTWREKLLNLPSLISSQAWKMASKSLLVIAIPVSLANIIMPLMTYAYTRILTFVDIEAVAAFGIASRIEAFAIIPIMAVAGGMAPLIGQNYGAGIHSRVTEALGKALRFSIYYGIGGAIVFFLVAPYIAGMFSDDELVKQHAMTYMQYVPLSYIALNIFAVTTSIMNATEMPKQALVLNLIKSFVIAIPLSYILTHHYGMDGFVWSVIATNIIGLGMCSVFLRRIIAR